MLFSKIVMDELKNYKWNFLFYFPFYQRGLHLIILCAKGIMAIPANLADFTDLVHHLDAQIAHCEMHNP